VKIYHTEFVHVARRRAAAISGTPGTTQQQHRQQQNRPVPSPEELPGHVRGVVPSG
jgi:hypothetical protein